MRFLFAALAAIVLTLGAPATARDVALIVDQQNYRYLTDLPRDRRIQGLETSLTDAGFEVTFAENASLGALRAAVFSVETAAQSEPSRLLVFLRGHFVQDGAETWLIASDSRAPDRFDLGSKALPLSLLNQALGHASGRAVLILADDPQPLTRLNGIEAGFAEMTPAQGVTSITGSTADGLAVVDSLLVAGITAKDIAERHGSVSISGFQSRSVPFSAKDAPGGSSQDVGEIAYWSAVRDIRTNEGYAAYLNRYPNGVFSEEARRLIAAQVADRETQLQNAESDLRLNRETRRAIQRDLSLLGFNPRGIDGVFGPATRRAIAAWQTDQGLEAHGYLDRDQRAQMQEAALRRAAALEEEARRRRQIEEARDRAFWQDSGATRTETGYRAYLKQFPDGLFADIARDELNAIEAERRAEMDAREREAWDQARNQNNEASYRAFLSAYPDGVFAEAAQTRIAELGSEIRDAQLRERYKRIENSVAGSGAARLLIEGRLAALGLEPGEADGKFTRDTRKALRRFQRARELEVTGYVDQGTMVQLLLGR